MKNKKLALVFVLATIALTFVVTVEFFLVQSPLELTVPLIPVEPEKAPKSKEPKEQELPSLKTPLVLPHSPVPPEQEVSPYNPLYQYGYGKPNPEVIVWEAPIDPRKRVLKGGWIITIEPDGPYVEPVWRKAIKKKIQERRDAQKALEEEWKHRA